MHHIDGILEKIMSGLAFLVKNGVNLKDEKDISQTDKHLLMVFFLRGRMVESFWQITERIRLVCLEPGRNMELEA